MQNTTYIIVKREKQRKDRYSQEHDFLAYPALFLISPRFLTVFSHACQVMLSPILQIMNNSLSRTRNKLLSEKWAWILYTCRAFLTKKYNDRWNQLQNSRK